MRVAEGIFYSEMGRVGDGLGGLIVLVAAGCEWWGFERERGVLRVGVAMGCGSEGE